MIMIIIIYSFTNIKSINYFYQLIIIMTKLKIEKIEAAKSLKMYNNKFIIIIVIVNITFNNTLLLLSNLIDIHTCM